MVSDRLRAQIAASWTPDPQDVAAWHTRAQQLLQHENARTDAAWLDAAVLVA